MRTRAVLAAAAAALPLLLAGCGGSSDDAAAAPDLAMTELPSADAAGPAESTEDAGGTPSVDPCALVTKADAEKLVRAPVLAPDVAPESCTYNAPPGGETVQVLVAVGPGAKKFYDIDTQLKHEFRALPGVADEAWAEDGAVFLRSGDLWVAVSMVKLNDSAENRTPLETVAKTVAGRL